MLPPEVRPPALIPILKLRLPRRDKEARRDWLGATDRLRTSPGAVIGSAGFGGGAGGGGGGGGGGRGGGGGSGFGGLGFEPPIHILILQFSF